MAGVFFLFCHSCYSDRLFTVLYSSVICGVLLSIILLVFAFKKKKDISVTFSSLLVFCNAIASGGFFHSFSRIRCAIYIVRIT